MNEKINNVNIYNTSESQKTEGVVRQTEQFYRLNQIDGARAFPDTIPAIDLDKPDVREMLVDTCVAADDVDYFYN